MTTTSDEDESGKGRERSLVAKQSGSIILLTSTQLLAGGELYYELAPIVTAHVQYVREK